MIHEFVRMCESVGMAQTVCVLPPAEDRERLLAIVADRNRPLKHVQRAHCPGIRRLTCAQAQAGNGIIFELTSRKGSPDDFSK
jgi:hypothetical protein